ncbi:hypothetical protein [Sulfitobacter sp. R86518]|uniref:hypothetical protein n=1 Tax=Sulfitobacter sp. R86518 TaxID=3093858 RepID=UPI0036D97319
MTGPSPKRLWHFGDELTKPTFIVLFVSDGNADFAAVCFAASARAAFPCERSTGLSAVQQFAPNLPLDRVTPDGIQNDISLRLAPTIKAVGLCSRWLRLHEWLL